VHVSAEFPLREIRVAKGTLEEATIESRVAIYCSYRGNNSEMNKLADIVQILGVYDNYLRIYYT